ncbi:MAG TPA: hypothetical protein VHG92_05795 [Afifellaceae bacterium]|nr:hypothetical protein [Afifellaceae bacterium]
MLVRSLGMAALLLAAAPAEAAWQAATPYPPPPVPACRDIIAQHGERGVWMGHFSGRRHSGGDHGTAVYGRVGCFLSEAQCRDWQNRNMAFAAAATIMSCRPLGGRAR